jgi:hypothetical protein
MATIIAATTIIPMNQSIGIPNIASILDPDAYGIVHLPATAIRTTTPITPRTTQRTGIPITFDESSSVSVVVPVGVVAPVGVVVVFWDDGLEELELPKAK